jgi:hypothetical protein
VPERRGAPGEHVVRVPDELLERFAVDAYVGASFLV